jgi:hypothetical protein
MSNDSTPQQLVTVVHLPKVTIEILRLHINSIVQACYRWNGWYLLEVSPDMYKIIGGEGALSDAEAMLSMEEHASDAEAIQRVIQTLQHVAQQILHTAQQAQQQFGLQPAFFVEEYDSTDSRGYFRSVYTLDGRKTFSVVAAPLTTERVQLTFVHWSDDPVGDDFLRRVCDTWPEASVSPKRQQLPSDITALPMLPPLPGQEGWAAVFDWYYRAPRWYCRTLKDLAERINYTYSYTSDNHRLYVNQYGERPLPPDRG